MTSKSDELKAFRDEWKKELNQERHLVTNPSESATAVSSTATEEQRRASEDTRPDVEVPFPFQFTDNLLQTWQDLPATSTKAGGSCVKCTAPETDVDRPALKRSRRSLVDVFLDDLNDVDDIPFFDINLPREIAVKIFSFLTYKDLCSCSQVSQAWHSLAGDNVLWEKVYRKWRRTFTSEISVATSERWKEKVAQCFIKTRLLKSHWQEHKCHVTYYHHARGGILTSVDANGADSHVIAAGYTNGQVKLWDLLKDESRTLESCSKSLKLVDEGTDEILSTSENSVTCVKMDRRGRKVTAGYNHGFVQCWDCEEPDGVRCIGYTDCQVTDVCMADSADIAYATVKAADGSRCEVKVMNVTSGGLTHLDNITIRETSATWTLPKVLATPLLTDTTDTSCLVFLRRDSVLIHRVSASSRECSTNLVENFYATHFTCLDSSQRLLSLGMISHLGVQAEYKVRCYDPVRLCHVSDLRSHTSRVQCVDSSYTGSLITTGCHDRRVRLFDGRLPTAVACVNTFTGHAGSVECVQSDDWKIISGDSEGYILVWDQRMRTRLWESQSRHPVKMLRFSADRLVSANIPIQQCMDVDVDSDKMTHIRYRGRLQVSDFSVGHSSSTVPSICSSFYDSPDASTYNLSLITPYDTI